MNVEMDEACKVLTSNLLKEAESKGYGRDSNYALGALTYMAVIATLGKGDQKKWAIERIKMMSEKGE